MKKRRRDEEVELNEEREKKKITVRGAYKYGNRYSLKRQVQRMGKSRV